MPKITDFITAYLLLFDKCFLINSLDINMDKSQLIKNLAIKKEPSQLKDSKNYKEY